MSDFNVENNVFLPNHQHISQKKIEKSLLKGNAPADSIEISSKVKNAEKPKRGFLNNLVDKLFGYSTECTDGNNDGKLSFKEKISSIGRGTLNMITNLVDSVIEHPFITLGTTAATIGLSALAIGAGIISAPALAIVGGTIGLGFGIFNIAKGIHNAKNATTDTQAKLAYEGIGEGTANVAVSAFSISKGVKSIKQIKAIAKEASTYANSAQSSAQRAKSNLDAAEKAIKPFDKTQHLADEAEKINKEIIKISDGVTQTTDDAKKAQSIFARIKTSVENSRDNHNMAQNALSETRSLTQEAQDCAMRAQKAAQAAKKAASVKMAVKQRDIAKAAAERAIVCADTTESNLGTIKNCVQCIDNNLSGINSELSALQRVMVDIDTKISGFDYTGVHNTEGRSAYSYGKSNEVHKFGIDPSGEFAREDMRQRLYDRDLQSGLGDEFRQTKAIQDPCSLLEPQIPEGSKYYELGRPRIHSKTGKPAYVCPNLQLASDGNGVRGKTPLAGKPGRYTPILKSVEKAGIKRIIDLRVEGECSQGARKLVEELGMEYHNFPVSDCDWDAESLHKITRFIRTINKGDYFVGCANGESRTDLAVMINYLFNPEARNVPGLVYGSRSTTKTVISQNMRILLDLIKGNEGILAEWGWGSPAAFFEEFNSRYAALYSAIGAKI